MSAFLRSLAPLLPRSLPFGPCFSTPCRGREAGGDRSSSLGWLWATPYSLLLPHPPPSRRPHPPHAVL
jgi:hypothetical protein